MKMFAGEFSFDSSRRLNNGKVSFDLQITYIMIYQDHSFISYDFDNNMFIIVQEHDDLNKRIKYGKYFITHKMLV